jgi:phosphohistidine phosphatase
MNLYIIRHAIAVEAGAPGYEDDSQRPLTGKGRKKMEQVAQGLKKLDAEIDVMLTSPYVRAADTAKIVRKVFGLSKDQMVATEYLMPTGYADQLINLINEKYASVANLALVGHEPYLGNLISVLVAGDPDVAFDLKKGGVCLLTAEALQYGKCATLEWFLAPIQLAELGA